MNDMEKYERMKEIASRFKEIGILLEKENLDIALEKANALLNEAKQAGIEEYVIPAENIIESIGIMIKSKKETSPSMTPQPMINNPPLEPVVAPIPASKKKRLDLLEIPLTSVNYDKKEKRISIDVLDFSFIGQYFYSSQLSEILDDLHASLKEVEVDRVNVKVVDPRNNNAIVDQDLKIKYLDITKKTQEEEILGPQAPIPYPETPPTTFPEGLSEQEDYTKYFDEETPAPVKQEMYMETEVRREVKPKTGKKKKLKSSAAESRKKPVTSIPPPSSPAGPSLPIPTTSYESFMPMGASMPPPTPKEKVHDINMGLQYYAVMMEQQTYLFYVYLSHKELVIEDEEGKTVYETTFQIVTTKEEPPQLDLRIEGDGFEIHPIKCTMVVDENAVSQPVMIFSITALAPANMPEKQRKKGYRRYLHIFIDFEGKNVSHTILAAIIQTKHISLKLGPIDLNLSKIQAMGICLLSISISLISFLYTLLRMDFSALAAGGSEGIIPGAGSLVFLASFMMTILKKGVFPIKKKVAGMIDFTKTAGMMK